MLTEHFAWQYFPITFHSVQPSAQSRRALLFKKKALLFFFPLCLASVFWRTHESHSLKNTPECRIVTILFVCVFTEKRRDPPNGMSSQVFLSKKSKSARYFGWVEAHSCFDFLRYLAEDHSSVSEFSGICVTESIFTQKKKKVVPAHLMSWAAAKCKEGCLCPWATWHCSTSPSGLSAMWVFCVLKRWRRSKETVGCEVF